MIKPERDQKAAEGAVHMAVDHGARPAIAVDDDVCLAAMLERVTKLLDGRGLSYEIERGSGCARVSVQGAGTIAIVAADRLVGKPKGAA